MTLPLRTLLLVALGFAAACPGGRAQPPPSDPEAGRPPIRNWTMRDYGAYPQNWVARRDAEGRLYFGNRDGVLLHDGQSWRVLPMPGLFVRGLDFGADGRLYAGAVDELGYFERTALGEWGPYLSLRAQLPAEDRAFGDVRAVHALPDGVYFVGDKRLARWHAGQFKVWRFAGELNVIGFRMDDRLYLHRRGEPLLAVAGEALVPAVDLPEVRAERLAAVLPWEQGGQLLVWPGGDAAVLQAGRLTAWAPAARAWLREQRVRTARLLGGRHVAILTEQGGVALFDRAGTFLRLVDVPAGLYNPVVRDVLLDAEGGLWFALNHGVAHVDALAGIGFFDGQNGLGRSTVRAVVRHAGTIYAATGEGVYRLVAGSGSARFEAVAGAAGDALALYSHASGVLVGSVRGIALLPAGGGPPEVVATGTAHQMIPRGGRADALWIAGREGVYPLTYDGARWRLGERLPGPAAEVRTLVELPDGALWGSTPTRGLLRWRTPAEPAEVVLESHGLPSGHGWLRIVRWGQQLVVSSQLGLFRWQAGTQRFEPLAVADAQPGEGSRNLHGGDPRHLWTFFGRDRKSARLLRLDAAGVPAALPQGLVQALGDIETMWHEAREGREVLWVGGSFGLARVELPEAFRTPGELKTVLGPIDRAFDPVWRDGAFAWPHGQADLAVHFAATTYRSGGNLEFQSRLEGYDRGWSPWSPVASREFTNLSAGRYLLRVRARDADGRLGREASLGFMVLPPWWQTGWAYGGYVAGALLLIYGIVRWRVRAGERERARLQQLVAERTCQLVESQQSLQQAKEAAEAANRAKSAFLASMSHELRTPLNSVLGYAQILRRSPDLGPASQRALETIQRSGDHLLHLINEVLDLAKVEAGRIELHEAPFSLGRFAQSITDLFALRAAEKGLAFGGPDAEALAVTVRGDEPRLRQVLLNLLGNAFKFTERGRVRWAIEAAGPGRWRIEVVDTGVGIAPEEQARVFEPFYQSAARPALSAQGTGLGLSIGAHLVQLMGGRLLVESEPGRGSRFWFEISLPVVQAAAAAEPAAPALDWTAIAGYRGRRRRLLVVDDERVNRGILVEMLTPLGFVLEEADGAAAARAAVARQAPHAVLLDLRMPGDNGFALAREWRAQGTLLGGKVLALSASVLPEQQAEALAAGCDAFLAKPFREEQLLRVLGSLLGLEWVYRESPAAATAGDPATAETEVRWEAGMIERLLQLAEHGDALRLGQELAALARRGAGWAAAVAPWQKLAVGYQMETLSRALEETLRRSAHVESR